MVRSKQMPRLASAPAIALAIVLVGGCDDGATSDAGTASSDAGNAGRLFIDMQYATRCDATLHCASTTMRDICGIDDGASCNTEAQAVNASCMITQSDATRTLTFSAAQPVTASDDFSIGITGATIPIAGGSASGSCRVTVWEGPNVYEGACGPGAPTEAQPCQLHSVAFSRDPVDGAPVVEGSLFCQFLPSRSNPSLELEVTAFGSGPTAASAPGHFRIRNCDGLTLEP